MPELEIELIPLVQDQIGDLAGVESPVEVKVYGPDPAVLRSLASEVGALIEEVPGVVDVNTHVFLGNPNIVVRPDSVQTARVGLTEMDIETQLNAALYGQVASTIPEQDRMTKIRVRYPDRVRFDKDRLGQLPISLAAAAPGSQAPAAGGQAGAAPAGTGFVPLDQLAAIEVVRGPNEMWRENQQPVITVTAELEPVTTSVRSIAPCKSGWPISRFRRAIAGNWPAIIVLSKNRSAAWRWCWCWRRRWFFCCLDSSFTV